MQERSFRGLLVWRQAMSLARNCYFLTKKLPKEELYGLIRQMRRAAVSVPANIAEGSGRSTKRDFVNFLRISQGSLRELETYLELIVEVGLVSRKNTEDLQMEVESVAKLLNRLIQSLQPPT